MKRTDAIFYGNVLNGVERRESEAECVVQGVSLVRISEA
jgi:hypothetical protein